MRERGVGDDDRFDAMLRDLGPDVPCPELDPAARARLMAVIRGESAANVPRSGGGWRLAAVVALAASLGMACLALGITTMSAQRELATARWETDEALTLLMRARQNQAIVPVAEDLGGVRPEDLVVLTFDHELCPIARVCTPMFREMQARHDGEAERFVALDVTGDRRDEAETAIDAMGIGFALSAPLGAETGVVKVLDMSSGRVLSSAPGERGLEMAEMVLARAGKP